MEHGFMIKSESDEFVVYQFVNNVWQRKAAFSKANYQDACKFAESLGDPSGGQQLLTE